MILATIGNENTIEIPNKNKRMLKTVNHPTGNSIEKEKITLKLIISFIRNFPYNFKDKEVYRKNYPNNLWNFWIILDMVFYLIVNKQYTDLVNEYFQRRSRVAFHQTAGIIKLPVVSVGSEVEGQGCLMAGAWMANGGKGGHRFVLPWILQRADNGAMAAHARAKSG